MKLGIATFVTDEGIRPGPLGRALEERGFDSVFLAEHSHIPTSRESPYPGGGDLPRVYYRTLDPFAALTAMAGTTTDLLLGTGIALLPQRDVIHTPPSRPRAWTWCPVDGCCSASGPGGTARRCATTASTPGSAGRS